VKGHDFQPKQASACGNGTEPKQFRTGVGGRAASGSRQSRFGIAGVRAPGFGAERILKSAAFLLAKQGKRMPKFCDRDSPEPSVLILSHVATGFTAGLTTICAVLAKAHIVRSHAKRAVSFALAVGLVLVTLHADKFVCHWFSL
jgi:hypothetical protein